MDTSRKHDRKECVLNAFGRAITEDGHNNGSIAAHVDCDESYISRVLSGASNLAIWFVMRLPVSVKRRLCSIWAEDLGGVAVWPAKDEKDALQKLASADLYFKQAKATLKDGEQRKVG